MQAKREAEGVRVRAVGRVTFATEADVRLVRAEIAADLARWRAEVRQHLIAHALFAAALGGLFGGCVVGLVWTIAG